MMITRIIIGTGAENIWMCFGLSTDMKPINAPNGSKIVEMDTAKEYYFDGENKEWIEWAYKGD